jgi:CheY-like chemotaxis protein
MEPSQKPKVLLVEDIDFFHGLLKEKLGDKIIVLSAFTIDQARDIFEKNPDIKAVIMDFFVPGKTEQNTLGLTGEIRAKFSGPMIATSATSQTELLKAGCDHETDKQDAWKKIKELLGL